MEEDLHKTQTIQLGERVQERLKRAIDTAEHKLNYDAAHNKELLRALETVRQFLKTSGRVCYGGTAMNAILPTKKRFYNPEVDLPDYDFFTPEIEKDTDALVNLMKKEGFKDVYHRVGMHEGTRKILVNFVPIADISELPEPVYTVLHRRAVSKGGLRYVDPDVLRMMMYLELSRPKGEVARWEKVYERLQLINNTFAPKRAAKATRKKGGGSPLPRDTFRTILDFCISSQRPLLSGDLATFYRDVISGAKRIFTLQDHSGPVAFLSPDIRADAKALQAKLGNTTGTYHAARGELVPEYVELRTKSGSPVALLFQETACHSFLNFPVPDGRSLAIASLDTLITMYYSIGIFTKRAKLLMRRALTETPELVRLVESNRELKKTQIPAFPLTCSGYQKGFATLLREKVERIHREKERGAAATRKTKKRNN